MNRTSNSRLPTAKDFATSTSVVRTASPEDTVESALAVAESSHEPVFVYNEKNKFLGLLSTHSLRYQHRFPSNTKIKRWRAMTIPPLITKQTSLPRVAQFMLDTRLYTLPIFNETGEEVIGVISAPTIFQKIAKQYDHIHKAIADRIKPGPPATIDANATLDDVYHFLREAGRSRVILVDEKSKSMGIISRRDVEQAFRLRTQKNRFISRSRSSVWAPSFVEEEVPNRQTPAIEFATTELLTASERTSSVELIQQLLTQKRSSIIVIDKYRRPVGLISTHSILSAISALPPDTEVPILFHHAKLKDIGEFRVEKIRTLTQQAVQNLHAESQVRRVEISIEQPKNQAQQTVLYNIKIRVFLWSGKRYLAHEKQYPQKAKHIGLESGIRAALKEIQEQVRRERQK